MSAFGRSIRLDTIPPDGRDVAIAADAGEMTAIAGRLAVEEVRAFEAEVRVSRKGDEVCATGRVRATVVQRCAATDAPLEAAIDEAFDIVFRLQAPADPDEEIELSEGECDVVFYDGGAIDLGEAVADTVALALDPYPRAADAQEALERAGVSGEDATGPLAAALKGLKKA